MTDTQSNEEADQFEQKVPPVDLRKSLFHVTTVDGTEYRDLKLMPGDIVSAERQYGIRASDLEGGGAKLEHMLWMIWRAAQRKNFTNDFEVFVETVEDLDITTKDGSPINPTQPAPR